MPLVGPLVPVLGDQAGLDQPGDVALEGEVDVVGLEAVRPRRGSGRPEAP